jgi:uncharacterized membrane protein YtjA (UPF0391 family)
MRAKEELRELRWLIDVSPSVHTEEPAMFGWALGFFVAAIIAAMFGFGVVASTFAGIAMILFWVFVGLLVVSLLLSLFSGHGLRLGDSHAPVAHGKGPGGTIALVAIAAVVGILIYSWVQNDWSAEKAGRVVDREAAEITADASEVLEDAGDRAGNLVDSTGDELRNDAAEGLDNAQETVAPDSNN